MGNGRALVDLTGLQFGFLTVVRLARKELVPGHKTTTIIWWLCKCVCGVEKEVSGANLRCNTKSCGCQKVPALRRSATKHGHNPKEGCTPEYRAWLKIKERCLNPNDKRFDDYGGRGICVHPDWLSDFNSFYQHVGDRPTPRHSIDRIRVNEGYVPGNIRWATRVEQANNKRNNVWIDVGEMKMTMAQWARHTGIPASVVCDRIKRYGWSPERAVTEPVRK